ncbi:TVP38/TMEM64 family protein [Halarsenatibacter silvermanii]|nr:VTT domain-containing protein [Halarsenatibacter silvermanii]
MALKIFLAGLLFAIIYFFWDSMRFLDIREIVFDAENRFRGTMAILFLFAAKSIFFFLPAPLLYILAGMLLSTPLAFSLICAGLFLEFSLTYFYGAMLGSDFVEKILTRSQRFQKLLNYNLENDLKLAFTLRLTPINLEAVSLVMGASGSKFWRFIAASLMGIVPKLLVYILIGNAIVHPITVSTIALFVIMLGTWAAVVIVLNRNYVLPENTSQKQK